MKTPRTSTWLLALLLGLAACGGGGFGETETKGNLNEGLANAMGNAWSGAVAEAFARPLTSEEPAGTSARITVRTEGPTATVRVEYDAGRTPVELELTIGLGAELAQALLSVEIEDSACPEPDVTIALEGSDLQVRIAHPGGPETRADTAIQEIHLVFGGVDAAADSIAIHRATAVDDEDRPVRFIVVPAGD